MWSTIIINTVLLLTIDNHSPIYLIWPPVYTLLNILCITGKEFLGQISYINEYTGKNYVSIRNSVKWFIYSFINVGLVVLSYSIIYFLNGLQFDPIIDTWQKAIYLSIMTFSTLGYGDIIPLCDNIRIIISSELMFFILIVLGKLPIAMSVIKVEVEE